MSEEKEDFNLFKVMFGKNFFAVMIGMIVFGFMDNAIMVIAGSAIDTWIQETFGFSSMFSAGLGNTLSDAVGVLSGSLVARMVYNSFGKVTEEDLGHHNMFIAAETIGIIIGCLIGLLPLAFL
ncbi:MAG: hypothetical protein GQ570_08090 [Helicobacteraceae bacterium]|nr:hypothetical protein [Helicobacteraceae bacterium]